MTFDPFTIIMLAVLAVLIFFMFRNSRKRKADAEQLQSKVQPGAKVMTNFGVFGTILSIDDEENRCCSRPRPAPCSRFTVRPSLAWSSRRAAEATAVDRRRARVRRARRRRAHRDHATTDETPETKKSDD